ncbi:MAG: flippase-like domain-containing protein [Chloroflexota bacterium]|nr:flippase-like domain-containing protein [Chloroflexota bacterium]
MNALGNLRGKLIIGLVLGLVVVAGLSVYADFNKMLEVLRHFEWGLVPFILLFTLFNYALRFYKWDVYLRLIGATGVPKRTSLLIFLSGFAMAMTPGKVGEILKSYLLRQVRGTPIATSAPIVMAERLTDGVAMLVLASVGLFLFNYGTAVLIGIAIFVLIFVFVFQNRALAARLLSMGERLPVISKVVHHISAFYESSYELFKLPNLLFGVAIGVISWSGEVAAFVLVMMGLGIPFSALLVVICAFILSASTLIGSVTLLPGGLGSTDASITGMLLFLVPGQLHLAQPFSQTAAVAATLLVRFATLWFGVIIGLIALTLTQRHLHDVPPAEEEMGTVSDRLARAER